MVLLAQMALEVEVVAQAKQEHPEQVEEAVTVV